MCGRFTLRTPLSVLIQQFELDLSTAAEVLPPDFELRPRYNIAPTQDILAVRSIDGRRELSLLRWGLVPHWATDPSIGNRLLNARADTLAEKPAFREALKRRRCLIPADGYYEWQKVGKAKQACLMSLAGDRPFAFAGLWETWQPASGPRIDSCTIITTKANDATRGIHDRMPAILRPDEYAAWLGEQGRAGESAAADSATHAETLRRLLRPWAGELLRITKVSSLVNKPQNETAACVEPLVDDAASEAAGDALPEKAPKRSRAKRSTPDPANRTLFD